MFEESQVDVFDSALFWVYTWFTCRSLLWLQIRLHTPPLLSLPIRHVSRNILRAIKSNLFEIIIEFPPGMRRAAAAAHTII